MTTRMSDPDVSAVRSRAAIPLLTAALLTAAAFLAVPAPGTTQTVFRSTQSANLPTAAMLNQGNWMFEVTHRFEQPFSIGSEQLWGLDGTAYNRLGLTWAAHEKLMVAVSRTNVQDNLELNAKTRLLTGTSESLPFELGAMGGVAWNVQEIPGADDNEVQAYVQLIANVLVADKLALGVVPTLLYNPRIPDPDTESVFVLGLEGQYYFNPTWSFLGEWIVSEERAGLEFDSGTFGLEVRTRGHFFKLLVTNQVRPNPTLFLGGSPYDFTDPDAWRFGFNITRLLPL